MIERAANSPQDATTDHDVQTTIAYRLWLTFSLNPGMAEFMRSALSGEATVPSPDAPTERQHQQLSERLAVLPESEQQLVLQMAQTFINAQIAAEDSYSHADFGRPSSPAAEM